MIKAIDRAAVITDVRVLAKSGGRRRRLDRGAAMTRRLTDPTALVITVSTRAAAGVYDDKSGPIIADALRELGFDGRRARSSCPTASAVGDALRRAVAARARAW